MLFGFVVLMFFLLFGTAANAFSFKVVNDTNERLTYDIYWVDHFFDVQQPIALITSVLDAGQTEEWTNGKEGYNGQVWHIVWRTLDGWERSYSFEISVVEVVKQVIFDSHSPSVELDQAKAAEYQKKEEARDSFYQET